MAQPTPDTTIADLIETWPASRGVLARHGMACVGCAMAPFETIAEVAAAYGFDAGAFIREIVTAHTGATTRATLRRRKDARFRSIDDARQRRSS